MSSPVSGRPLPSSFDENEEFYNESGFQKVLGRMKREPLVPIGCLITVAAFTNAYRAMRKGDHHQVQRMFRARVIAQGFTVAAMVAGGLYFGAERHKERENWKAQQAEKDEEKRARWIRELEARDDEEKQLKAMLDRRREKKQSAGTEAARESFRAAEAKRQEGEPVAASAHAGEGKKAGGSGWGAWFGGSKADASQPKPSPDDSPK
ncbi:Respiratory supercomplex factor 1, mitochondrial [Cytospora mali]|uniref:Respiratory supercomplex factor 1, mitochondrial n=1 Tax=Cytospora mali TaxID=578113 RepID=A0A194W0Q1_CYTMA|nr:Respiratory supercomplex factor 1, mitochondrial [Valsa mali]